MRKRREQATTSRPEFTTWGRGGGDPFSVHGPVLRFAEAFISSPANRNAGTILRGPTRSIPQNSEGPGVIKAGRKHMSGVPSCARPDPISQQPECAVVSSSKRERPPLAGTVDVQDAL